MDRIIRDTCAARSSIIDSAVRLASKPSCDLGGSLRHNPAGFHRIGRSHDLAFASQHRSVESVLASAFPIAYMQGHACTLPRRGTDALQIV